MPFNEGPHENTKNHIIMKQKTTYEVPEVELVDVRLEGAMLTLSNGVTQAPNVEGIAGGDIFNDPNW